jgi:hypothetical protein
MAKALQPCLLFIVGGRLAHPALLSMQPAAAADDVAQLLETACCLCSTCPQASELPRSCAGLSHTLPGAQDEIDSLGQSRRGDDDRASRRLLTELLLQMTAAAQEESVYIFAATNRLQVRPPQGWQPCLPAHKRSNRQWSRWLGPCWHLPGWRSLMSDDPRHHCRAAGLRRRAGAALRPAHHGAAAGRAGAAGLPGGAAAAARAAGGCERRAARPAGGAHARLQRRRPGGAVQVGRLARPWHAVGWGVHAGFLAAGAAGQSR